MKVDVVMGRDVEDGGDSLTTLLSFFVSRWAGIHLNGPLVLGFHLNGPLGLGFHLNGP